MSLADLPAPVPHGRAAVTRVVFSAVDVDPVRALLLEECERRGLDVDETGPDLFLETFLDTRDRRVHRAGTFLVHRDFGGGSEIGWGTLRGADLPGDLPPFGTSVALPSTDPRIPEDCPEPMRGALRALAGRRPLRPVLRMDVRREELLVKRAGRWLGTVVLMRAVATRESPIHGVRISRVEIRAAVDASGATDALFETLRERAGLHGVSASTYEAALLAAAVPDPGRHDPGPAGVHLGITSGELAFSILRKQFAEVVRREPGARLGLDPEELHKLRVGVRRMRAALRVWRHCLGPGAAELQRAWGELGTALGDTRDWDVELENLEAWAAGLSPGERLAFGFLEDWAIARREEARLRMLAALDSRQHERLTRLTSRWLREGHALPVAASRPARRDVGRLVRERYRALRRRARRLDADSPGEDLHRARILAKKLRYCLEFHDPILGPDARRMVRDLVRIQDLLGEIQDLHVSLDRLPRLAEDGGALVGISVEGLLARLRTERLRKELELRAEVPAALARLKGSAWARLKTELGTGT